MEEPLCFKELITNGENFLDSFDEYFRLSLSTSEFNQIAKNLCPNEKNSNIRLTILLQKILKLFATGLEDRIGKFGYYILYETPKKPDIADSFKKSGNINILLGFTVTKQWCNPITLGPVANDPVAKEFRSFWHDATVLRKFADSRVCECMVWGEQPSTSIPRQILRFLLNKYYGLADECLIWKSSFFDPSADKQHRNEINQAFSSLSTILRSLKNIPLAITNIHGVSPFLRGTEPQCEQTQGVNGEKLTENRYMPSIKHFSKFTPSIEIFIKLAFSTKWGNDVENIKKLNTAFYLQIAEQLQNVHKIIAVATEEYLYVVQDKIVFRLTIVNEKLHKVLEDKVTKLKSMGATRIESSEEGKALSDFYKKYISELQLASSLHSYSLKCGIFSSTVQLMKLWLGSHQMSDILSDFALEMIVVAALESNKDNEPGSTLSAFRRCLKFLVNHKWISQPVFVDFDSTWTEQEKDDLEVNFIKMRPVLPPMVIITNDDETGTRWTKDGPSPIMLKRIIGVAENTLKIIDNGIIKTSNVDLMGSVMQTSFESYDLIITLHSKVVTRSIQTTDEEELKGLPVVDFDPVSDFVEAAQNYFGSSALFFYNKYGGNKIAVKFKPSEAEVPAKISRCSLHITKDRNSLRLNREEIIEGLEIYGKNMIKSVEKNY